MKWGWRGADEGFGQHLRGTLYIWRGVLHTDQDGTGQQGRRHPLQRRDGSTDLLSSPIPAASITLDMGRDGCSSLITVKMRNHSLPWIGSVNTDRTWNSGWNVHDNLYSQKGWDIWPVCRRIDRVVSVCHSRDPDGPGRYLSIYQTERQLPIYLAPDQAVESRDL